MIKNIFKQAQLPVIEKIMDIANLRQKAIASNVANAQTPGYRAKNVDFAGSLENALNEKRTLSGGLLNSHPRHMAGNSNSLASSQLIISESGQSDMEREMASSAENQLLFATAAKIASSRFRAIRSCIRGRS